MSEQAVMGLGTSPPQAAVVSWEFSHNQEGFSMDAETKQIIARLMKEISELKERVANIQLRDDDSFIVNTALMLTVSVTAGALDSEAKERGKRLFSNLKSEFNETPYSNIKAINAAVLLQAEEYIAQFFE